MQHYSCEVIHLRNRASLIPENVNLLNRKVKFVIYTFLYKIIIVIYSTLDHNNSQQIFCATVMNAETMQSLSEKDLCYLRFLSTKSYHRATQYRRLCLHLKTQCKWIIRDDRQLTDLIFIPFLRFQLEISTKLNNNVTFTISNNSRNGEERVLKHG